MGQAEASEGLWAPPPAGPLLLDPTLYSQRLRGAPAQTRTPELQAPLTGGRVGKPAPCRGTSRGLAGTPGAWRVASSQAHVSDAYCP